MRHRYGDVFMSVIESIKNKFHNAIIPCCSENRCELKLNSLSNRVVLKGEKICQDSKICDCIIFTGDIIIGIVELKSRVSHASKIVEKLTNGSEIALNILEACNNKDKFKFCHLVLAKKWPSSSELRIIDSKKIKVNGKKYDIIRENCGVSFSEVLSRFK